MSFDSICKNCGAPSGPSVGICPFCKTPFSSNSDTPGDAQVGTVRELYENGKLPDALALAAQLEKEKPEIVNDATFTEFYVQILIESEGPSTKIRGLLMKMLATNPTSEFAKEYIEIMNGKDQLREGLHDAGEEILEKLLVKAPNNAHALFMLGSHLFWVDHEVQQSLKYLERCVAIKSNFLRGWGCLAAIYKSLGNVPLQQKAARKYLSLECNQSMRDFIQQQFL